MVSAEDVAKNEGEFKVAVAQVLEAKENIDIAKADLDLAKQTLDEHTIRAPFDGVIIKRMKNPGESVRANEAVVQLGNLYKLSANAYVPLDFAFRVKEGQVVEIQPRINTQGKGEPLAIEKKSFREQRSPLSIPRSSPWPRRPCGSAGRLGAHRVGFGLDCWCTDDDLLELRGAPAAAGGQGRARRRRQRNR